MLSMRSALFCVCLFLVLQCGTYVTNAEAESPTICQPYCMCGPQGTCTETTDETFFCSCGHGYSNETGVCEDINECEGPDICPEGYTCTNTIGSFNCDYCNLAVAVPTEMEQNGTFVCEPIGQCALNAGLTCFQNCKDTYDGPQCSCVDGFVLDPDNNVTCSYDEGEKSCIMDCGQGGECLNITCVCFDGYMLASNKSCVVIGSCDDIDNDCNFNVQCQNVPYRPGYFCDCEIAGLGMGSDGLCYDDSSCFVNPRLCGSNQNCANNSGIYTCECNDGYYRDFNTSECVEMTDVCAQSNAWQKCEDQGLKCRNIPSGNPGYDCICPVPFIPDDSKNPETCSKPDAPIYAYQLQFELVLFFIPSDINTFMSDIEVLIQTEMASLIGDDQLMNVNAISCTVSGGGKSAVVVSDIMISQFVNSSSLEQQLVDDCSSYSYIPNTCILEGSNLLILGSDSIKVSDEDICANGNTEFLCGYYGAICTSEPEKYSYTCSCASGYHQSGEDSSTGRLFCTDIDECTDFTICNPYANTYCHNTDGNYTCECVSCFIPGSNNSCKYICEDNPCENNGYCDREEVEGGDCGFSCSCSTDYTGPTCHEKNDALRVANNNVAIVGGVLGGCLAICLIVLIVVSCKCVKLQKNTV